VESERERETAVAAKKLHTDLAQCRSLVAEFLHDRAGEIVLEVDATRNPGCGVQVQLRLLTNVPREAATLERAPAW